MINILCDLLLVGFIGISVYILYRTRNYRFGVVVSNDENKTLSDGSGGLEISFGSSRANDICLADRSVQPFESEVKYAPEQDGAFVINEVGGAGGNSYGLARYSLGKATFSLSLPGAPVFYKSLFGLIAVLIGIVYAMLRAISFRYLESYPWVLVPFGMVVVYIIAMYFVRADNAPIIETAFAMLVTHQTEVIFYGANEEQLKERTIFAAVSVGLYLLSSIAVRFFLRYCKVYRERAWVFRAVAAAVIAVLAVVNLLLAKDNNGAYNWVKIGENLSFQPSELIKVPLIFMLAVPAGEEFIRLKNLFFSVGVPVCCMIYALLIRDSGVMVQYAVITVAALLVQNSSFLLSALTAVVAVIVCKFLPSWWSVLLPKLSTTAFSRINGWLGSGSFLDGLSGKGVWASTENYGYQSAQTAAAAFESGLFGAADSPYEVLKNVAAANSDLVIGVLGEKNGSVFVILTVLLFALIVIFSFSSLKQQDKTTQVLTVTALSLITSGVLLNIGGTLGVLPLTGIVLPALSRGGTAAISYGVCFGIISSTGVTRAYMNELLNTGKKRRSRSETNWDEE